MRVLLAFDKFKDALSATQACRSAAEALRRARPEWILDECPIADGGEGFTAILTAAAGGELRSLAVRGPRGGEFPAAFGMVSAARLTAPARARLGLVGTETIAVTDMSAASGLALLSPQERDVWQADSTGTGQLLRAAAAAGARAVVLGIGGSATSDLGLGALTAFGLELRDARDELLPPAPAAWRRVASLSGTMQSAPRIRIACDVTNPLLGPSGAAAVYGPQKGLAANEVRALDDVSATMARLLCEKFGEPASTMNAPGAGAAGGLGFGLTVALGAVMLPGFELVTEWLDLDARIAAADIVITGEGRFDDSSLSGKGPGGIAGRAMLAGKIVHVFAGAVNLTTRPTHCSAHAITPLGTPLPQALREAEANLTATVARVFGGGTAA